MKVLGRLGPRAGCVAVVLAALFVAPAWAAAPPNDHFAGATAIPSLPYTQTLDTTQATTDADDVEANADCGAPATQASVWYSLTPSADETPLVDVSNSSYEAGVIVVTGTPGNFNLLACGPGQVVFSANAGVTYSILAFGDVPDSSGGQLDFSISEAPPAPKVKVTVNPVATVTAGVVAVKGTVTCRGSAEFGPVLRVSLTQQVGRLTIYGKRSVDKSPCTGTTRNWTAKVTGKDGRFGAGKADVVVQGFACGVLDCGFKKVKATIAIRH
jgi:hypothetical protein